MPNESLKALGKCLNPQTRILGVSDDDTVRALTAFSYTVSSYVAETGVFTLNTSTYWCPGQKIRFSGGTAPTELMNGDYFVDTISTTDITLKAAPNKSRVDTTTWAVLDGTFVVTPIADDAHYIVTMRTTLDIRYRYDGGFLSKTVGCLLKAGESICLLIEPSNLRIVRATAGEAPVVTITLEG